MTCVDRDGVERGGDCNECGESVEAEHHALCRACFTGEPAKRPRREPEYAHDGRQIQLRQAALRLQRARQLIDDCLYVVTHPDDERVAGLVEKAFRLSHRFFDVTRQPAVSAADLDRDLLTTEPKETDGQQRGEGSTTGPTVRGGGSLDRRD